MTDPRESTMTDTDTCPACGHRHAGPALGRICIGCPCPGSVPSTDDAARGAALLALAQLLDRLADVAAAVTDDGFDDATAQLAIQWHRTAFQLDASRPGETVAGPLRDAAAELRGRAERMTA